MTPGADDFLDAWKAEMIRFWTQWLKENTEHEYAHLVKEQLEKIDEEVAEMKEFIDSAPELMEMKAQAEEILRENTDAPLP